MAAIVTVQSVRPRQRAFVCSLMARFGSLATGIYKYRYLYLRITIIDLTSLTDGSQMMAIIIPRM